MKKHYTILAIRDACNKAEEAFAKYKSDIHLKVDVAKRIWNITKISPEYGNAVMDVIGCEAYDNVMELQKITFNEEEG